MRYTVVQKCPACNGNALMPKFKRGDGLPVAKCGQCELLVLYKYPQNITDVYDTAYFDKNRDSSVDIGYSDYLKAVSPLDFVRHLAVVEAARLAIQKPRRLLLDVGAASGDFLALAHLFGWGNTQGVEPVPYARTMARRLGVIEQYATVEDIPSDCYFDFITAWELIEHLPDLNSFMRTMRSHLGTGGVFLCSTPDADQSLFYPRPEEWIGFHVSLEHLSYFTSASLHRLLTQFFPYVQVWTSATGTFFISFSAWAFRRSRARRSLNRFARFAVQALRLGG